MTKKLIFLSHLVVPVVFLSGCSQEQEQTKKDVQASGQTKPVKENVVAQPQSAPQNEKYADTKYDFTVGIPEGFYDAGVVDGLYAYTKYFSNKQLNGDFTKLSANDVQISIMISKDEKQISNDEKIKQVKISKTPVYENKNITIDGVSAVQQIEDGTKLTDTESGCSLATYFMKNGKSHDITMFTPGSCDIIKKYTEKYNEMIGSFKEN